MRVSGSFYVTIAAKDGEKGEPGSDGKGISQEVRYYQRSSSNSTAPTSWATTPPALTSTYRYLWSYIKTTYTDGSTNSTKPAVIGVYGDTGSKGDKGARMIMLYWSECAEGFPFYSGKEGEEYYHVVFESRSDTLRTSTCYLCISSYTKSSSSALPSKDTTHWMAFENVALIATDLMLSRKIAAEEIDVDSLTVRNVHAVSSDGNTTCHIDGETGKLTAKNVEIEGHIGPFNANWDGWFGSTIYISDVYGYVRASYVNGSLAQIGKNLNAIGIQPLILADNPVQSTSNDDKKVAGYINCIGYPITADGDNNVALLLGGGCVSGLRRRMRTVTSAQPVIANKNDSIIVCSHTSSDVVITVSETEHGHEIWVYSIKGQKVTFSHDTYTYNITDSKCHIFIYNQLLNVWLHSSMN